MFKIKNKIFLSILIAVLMIFNVSDVSFASKKDNFEARMRMMQNKYQNQLMKAGFPKNVIEGLTPTEIEEIIKYNGTYSGSVAQKSYFLSLKDLSAIENGGTEVMTLEVSEEEYKRVKNSNNRNSEAAKVLTNHQSVANNFITYYSDRPIVVEYIDGSILTITAQCGDLNDSTSVRKLFIATFEWYQEIEPGTIRTTPTFTLEDAVAVGFSGINWGIEDQGGFYYDGAEYHNYQARVASNGAYMTFNLLNVNPFSAHNGRVYVIASQPKAGIAQGTLINVFGDYGHKVFGPSGISCGFDIQGTPNLSISWTSKMIKPALNAYTVVPSW